MVDLLGYPEHFGVENLELSEGVSDEMVTELERKEPQIHADKSLLSCFELSFASNSFSKCQLRLCTYVFCFFLCESTGSKSSQR